MPDGCARQPLLGRAPTFLRVIDLLPTLAARDCTVLVEGETGTGKELVARAIHAASARKAHPFVIVNCGAIPDSLIEAELFGHARGAFTDGAQERIGLLATASRGTLCLDEVGSLSPHAQAALLRVLQDQTFRPLGATTEQRTDARFIALTNVPLWNLVTSGAFRSDLYFRLCVLSVRLPALRERREDIVLLAHHFLVKHARAENPVTRFAPDVRTLLVAYDWPGNVRQLEHLVLRAATLAPGPCVELGDIDLPDAPAAVPAESDIGQDGDLSFSEVKRQAVEAFERRYLTSLMKQAHGNVTQAARLAHKERRDLGKMLKKYQILPRTFSR